VCVCVELPGWFSDKQQTEQEAGSWCVAHAVLSLRQSCRFACTLWPQNGYHSLSNDIFVINLCSFNGHVYSYYDEISKYKFNKKTIAARSQLILLYGVDIAANAWNWVLRSRCHCFIHKKTNLHYHVKYHWNCCSYQPSCFTVIQTIFHLQPSLSNCRRQVLERVVSQHHPSTCSRINGRPLRPSNLLLWAF